MVAVSRNSPEAVKRISKDMNKARQLLAWQLRKWISYFVYHFSRVILAPEDVASWMQRYQPRWTTLFAESQNMIVLLDVVRTKLLEPMPAELAATLRQRTGAYAQMLNTLLADLHADVYDKDFADAGMQLELQDLERRCDYLLRRLNAVAAGVDKLVT